MTIAQRPVPPIKIALTGGMRSGKDTVAAMFVDAINSHCTNNAVRKMSFSEGITVIIETYLPELLEDGKPRKAYQQIGQLLRSFNENVWVDYAKETMVLTEQINKHSNFIFTDLRQPNEEEMLRELGFTIIKVTSDYSTRLDRAQQANDQFSEEDFHHETEHSIDSIVPDIIIANNGSLVDLQETVEEILVSEILYPGGE